MSLHGERKKQPVLYNFLSMVIQFLVDPNHVYFSFIFIVIFQFLTQQMYFSSSTEKEVFPSSVFPFTSHSTLIWSDPDCHILLLHVKPLVSKTRGNNFFLIFTFKLCIISLTHTVNNPKMLWIVNVPKTAQRANIDTVLEVFNRSAYTLGFCCQWYLGEVPCQKSDSFNGRQNLSFIVAIIIDPVSVNFGSQV